MKRNPLLIISCSRSGSSMLAGIFHHHGYWVGTRRSPDRHNAKGYFENLPIKKYMKWYFNDNIREANKGKTYDIADSDAKDFKAMVESVVKNDGYDDDGSRWLVKFGALYYRPWRLIYPECTTVCLFRDKESIINSGKRSFPVSRARADAQTKLMEEALADDPHTYRVDFERLIKKDYEQIYPVCIREGFEPDTDWMDAFIDPGMVHA